MVPVRGGLIEAQFAGVLDLSPIELPTAVKVIVKVVLYNATAPARTFAGIVADRNFSMAALLSTLVNPHDQATVAVVGGDINVSDADILAAVVQRPGA
jgi:hypothetical protein